MNLYLKLLENYHLVVPTNVRFEGWLGRWMFRAILLGALLLLRKVETVPRAEVEKFRMKLLRRILKDAYENSNFWKEHFDRNQFDPAQLRSQADYNKCPVTTKNILKGCYKEVVPYRLNRSPRKLLISTSGSTGTPTQVLKYRNVSSVLQTATKMRSWKTGKWTNTLRLSMTQSTVLVNLFFKYFVHNAFLCNVRSSSFDKDVSLLRKKILNGKPIVMSLTSGTLIWLSKSLERSTLKDAGIQVISTCAEQFPLESQKEMEDFFGIHIVHIYGMSEVGEIARQCTAELDTYHVHNEFILLEILDDGKEVDVGDQGDITVTCLGADVATPIIRYRTGDSGSRVPGECGCGVTSERIRLKGRDIGMIQLPSGLEFSSTSMTVIFSDQSFASLFAQFQIVQESLESIVVYIVPSLNNPPDGEDLKRLKDRLVERCCGESISISLEIVNYISADERTNKVVSFKSNL